MIAQKSSFRTYAQQVEDGMKRVQFFYYSYIIQELRGLKL